MVRTLRSHTNVLESDMHFCRVSESPKIVTLKMKEKEKEETNAGIENDDFDKQLATHSGTTGSVRSCACLSKRHEEHACRLKYEAGRTLHKVPAHFYSANGRRNPISVRVSRTDTTNFIALSDEPLTDKLNFMRSY